MDARVIIAKIRHQQPLENGELQWFANGLASGAVSDAQAGSFAQNIPSFGGLHRIPLAHRLLGG